MKIIMKIVGMGWETSIDAEVEGDKITFDRREFDRVMNLIAKTHDEVSGGFLVEYEEEKTKPFCAKCGAEVLIDIYENPNGPGEGYWADIACPNGHVVECVNDDKVNAKLAELREQGKIV